MTLSKQGGMEATSWLPCKHITLSNCGEALPPRKDAPSGLACGGSRAVYTAKFAGLPEYGWTLTSAETSLPGTPTERNPFCHVLFPFRCRQDAPHAFSSKPNAFKARSLQRFSTLSITSQLGDLLDHTITLRHYWDGRPVSKGSSSTLSPPHQHPLSSKDLSDGILSTFIEGY